MTDETTPGREEKTRWLDDPANIDRLIYGLCALSAVFLLPDLMRGHDRPFGFYAGFGFLAGTGLVLAAKVLRVLLMRPEDYYD